MEKHPRFLDLYFTGDVTAEEIDDHIEAWHDRQLTGPDSRVALHVYLGMTWAEYGRWATDGLLPTTESHQVDGRKDMTFVTFTGQPLVYTDPLRTHGPLRCRPTCPIHWPSDHAQAGWPRGWNPDKAIMTRVCTHGWHHPDPDDQQVRLHAGLAEHHCDGCCKPTIDGDLSWLSSNDADDDYVASGPANELGRRARRVVAQRRLASREDA
jgi:hypothetical protein